jgi:hypothetical protein
MDNQSFVRLEKRIRELETVVTKLRGNDPTNYFDKVMVNTHATTTAGQIRSSADVYPWDLGAGLYRRIVDPFALHPFTSHFPTSALPAGYAWLAAGNIDGTAVAVPASVVNRYSDYLYWYNPAGNVSFACDTTKTFAVAKSLYARMIPGYLGKVGLRVDNGADTQWFEVFITDSGGGGTCTFGVRAKDITGAATAVVTSGVVPSSPMYTLRLVTVSTTIFYAYLASESGDATVIGAFTFATAWVAGAAIRIGLTGLAVAQGSQTCDWYHSTF